MTAQEMSERIVATVVVDTKGASFGDILESCGPDAKGDLTLEFQDNLVLWHGVSERFAEAFNLIWPQRIDMVVLPPILVFTEPRRLSLPIAKHVRPYKTPRWLPVALLPKKKPPSIHGPFTAAKPSFPAACQNSFNRLRRRHSGESRYEKLR